MSMRLMIVDDETMALQVLKDILEPMGNDVTTFSDSRQAVTCLEEQRFDCILLDVNMPDPDGFELTRRARASGVNNRTPIVMLTGMCDVETMRKAFSAGASGFLGKPITRDRIHTLLAAMGGPVSLERRRSARLPYRTRVECRLAEQRESRFIAESHNIGEGGLLMEPSSGVEVGQQLNLEFQLPSLERPLHARARVLRKEAPDRVAVEFTDIAIRDREAIQQYIISRLQA
jgi:CheY-like chemotaxis protein